MQDPTVIEEPSYILSERDGSWVEAWTAWHLANCKPAQRSYRSDLRNAIKDLGAAGEVRATYTSDKVPRNLDTENVLFYNVGPSHFHNVATRILRFDRIDASPPPSPSSLAFEPRHHVRYERVTRPNTFPYFKGTKLAHCEPQILEGIDELRDTKKRVPRLWWLFKKAVVKATGATWSPSDRFAVQLHISGPEKHQLNLAKLVKPLMDGFLSALHHYEECKIPEECKKLDEIASRIAKLLKKPVRDVRSLLLDRQNALLGPRAVPHLYVKGLQWSPADHLLIAGEVVYDISEDHQPVKIRGCFFKPKRRSVSRSL